MGGIVLEDIEIAYGTGPSRFTAVRNLSLQLMPGQTVGLVGESGSGKSTVARAMVGLHPITRGRMLLDGVEVDTKRGNRRAWVREQLQMVFQDPQASLNPRMTVRAGLREALRARQSGGQLHSVATLLEMVGMHPDLGLRFPHQLSGGQRQRVAIARALAVQPRFLILDEVTSSLDVSVQASILNLLTNLQQSEKLGYLFISHDLAVVKRMAESVGVMHLGRIVEYGQASAIFRTAHHPYTRSLIDAVPGQRGELGRERIVLNGDVPNPLSPPTGCTFHPRCPIGPLRTTDRQECQRVEPVLREVALGIAAACHFPLTEGEIGKGHEISDRMLLCDPKTKS